MKKTSKLLLVLVATLMVLMPAAQVSALRSMSSSRGSFSRPSTPRPSPKPAPKPAPKPSKPAPKPVPSKPKPTPAPKPAPKPTQPRVNAKGMPSHKPSHWTKHKHHNINGRDYIEVGHPYSNWMGMAVLFWLMQDTNNDGQGDQLQCFDEYMERITCNSTQPQDD